MNIGLVLMASGAGSRFGANKLLAPFEGRTVAKLTMDAYPPALFQKSVVVSRYPEVLDMGAARGYLTAPNPWADEGISASIRIGVAQMLGCDGVLFAVCDQPWLTMESVEKVLAAFEANRSRIVALGWRGEKGNPCLFPAVYFEELAALTGDKGGGAIIRAHPETLFLVEAVSAQELKDVDFAGDLRATPSGSKGL